MSERVFCTFWHGKALPPLHRACLESFPAHGHRLRVYAYGALDVPHGVELADAAAILPESMVFEFEQSFSGFSNIFRYQMLLEHGGWWVDTDVYCVRREIPDAPRAWAHQDAETINGAILAFPAGDAVLRGILDESVGIGADVKAWGDLGPNLLTRHLAGRPWPEHTGSREAFYPVHWLETHQLWLPEAREDIERKCRDASFVHLWGSMFRTYGIDVGRAPPAGSYLERLLRDTSVYATLPPLDEGTETATRESIRRALLRPWVRPRAQRLLGYDLPSAYGAGDRTAPGEIGEGTTGRAR